MDKELIDNHTIKALMNLESVLSSLDEIFISMETEYKLAKTKGDEQLAEFIYDSMKQLNNVENRMKFGEEYLKNLLGLSWELYKGDITTRTEDEPNDE